MIRTGWVERVLVGMLLVIAALIVVHAPLSVWAGTTWPQYAEFIKAWKELLMAAALVLMIITAARRHKVKELLADRLMQLALVYAGLHFVMVGVFQNGLPSAGSGLLIDLRYILYFVVVYGTIQLLPQYRRLFIRVFVGGAVVVIGFALLQIFVLPKDILAHIGYSKNTIAPYLTVDENHDYIRINSTLRGPNPLGAYATIVIGLLTAVVLRWKMNVRGYVLAAGALLAAGLTLWASYSRSSAIAAVAALVVVAVVAASAKVRKRLALILAVVLVVTAGAIVALKDTPFIANVVLHNSPTTGASVDSNAGHIESLLQGTERLVRQPFGAGVGSTGSASLLTNSPFIMENQYLFIAHETGWLGLIVFVWLYLEVMRHLWLRRKSVLALGVFGSGIGLAIIGLLLPVWVDDTVSIVWWGLAAVSVGGVYKGGGRARKNN
ncbi:hypothetical protein KDA14_03060 [Candidatus Saccharibacteria bacterium]|nr:hypothetical protein [Candidatus Saccharibacteria bacterium]